MLAVDRAFARVDALLREACGTQFTGAVARIDRAGRVRFERAYGATRADGLARPVYVDTRFDLASITKVSVATMALQAVAENCLTLDAPLTAWFPQWLGTEREPIALRMLLAHDSGMNSGADYRGLLGYDVIEYALNRDLCAAPGERVVYSDLGFIAVGELLRRIYGRALSALIPGYNPRALDRAWIPATEDDGWRGRVQGVVHDEKAYLIGGAAGHAGLFGTAADVAALAERYLGPLHHRKTEAALPPDLIREATREQAYDPILRRGLGWALKTSDENSCGRWFSPQTFGHTGFVGTCVWVDPVRDCSGVLLTNSVYFGRNDTRGLRASFYEALIDDLGVR